MVPTSAARRARVQTSDAAIYLRKGTAVVLKGGKEVAKRGKGDFIGEMALLLGDLPRVSIKAESAIDAYLVRLFDYDTSYESLPPKKTVGSGAMTAVEVAKKTDGREKEQEKAEQQIRSATAGRQQLNAYALANQGKVGGGLAGATVRAAPTLKGAASRQDLNV